MKPLERPARYRKAGAVYSPAPPPLVRVEELITTPFSSRQESGMAPDHRLRPKPAREGGLRTETHQASTREELYPHLPAQSSTRLLVHQPLYNSDELHSDIATAAAYGRKITSLMKYILRT